MLSTKSLRSIRFDDVYDVANALERLPAGARVVRVLHLHGFGARHAGEAVAIDADGRVVAGRILAGLADHALTTAPASPSVLAVNVSDPDAEAAGMACGGHADLFVQPVDSIDPLAWRSLRQRRPVVVVTDVATGATRVVTDHDIAGTTGRDDPLADERARALLTSGRSTLEVEHQLMVESYLPPTTVRIIGHAGVGVALAAQADLLGWHHQTVDDSDHAVAAAEAQLSHDALVILSHDEAVDTPCLAAALTHGRGYVGALGSRGTQAARRERLADLGFDPAQLATIHGPVGLDLGSRTPAETAVAIVAEIIAHRSGRQAAPLAATDGPING